MAVLEDPIVSALVGEFNEVVDQLLTSRSDANVNNAGRLDVVKQLCELSRDARFHLGPAEYADLDQLKDVADCFEQGVAKIRSIWATSDSPDEIEAYCENILERARRCRVN